MKGHVYLVGAGPGDTGLMTVKGLELLRSAEVVVYDALASHSLLDECPDAELVDVGKRSCNHKKTQAEINEILVEYGRQGKRVVRLKGGDPFLFGRGAEEALALREAGIEVTVVPGVSSSISVPETCGIPVTRRGVASSVTIVTGHSMDGGEVDWKALAKTGSTLVILMGMSNAGWISAELIEGGLSADTPAAILTDGTRDSGRAETATLGTLESTILEKGLEAPGIMVIGDVVKERDRLGDLG